MFNKKEYKILKKKHSISVNKNNLKLFKYNNVVKNNKNNLLLKFIYKKYTVFLLHGNRNICSVTGKYKSIFNCLKISRHVIRKLGDTSALPNYSKLSWKC